MKKIALVLVAAMVLVFTGCEKKETISMPFDVADVNNIEMYRNAEPYSAEKQVITESEDIADLFSLFSGLEVSVLHCCVKSGISGETGLFYISRYWRSLG